MALLTQKATQKTFTKRVALKDRGSTTIHVVELSQKALQMRVVCFDKPTKLLDWCEANNVTGAINGGFFGNEINGAENGVPVGEVWIGGVQVAKTMSAFDRGCLYIDSKGEVHIGPRSKFPSIVDGDLLEVGPQLIKDGELVFESDIEGFSAESNFFDNDVTAGRAQRVAIACSDETVWLVVSEGRSPTEAGLTLGEMTQFLLELGVQQALNLDGGSAASLVIDQKLMNKPRMGADRDFREFPRGREIVTALVFSDNNV